MNVNAKAQYDFADQLSTSLQLDTRVRAIWLEGSLGNTTNADAYSDIDLHLLVNDESAFRQDIAKLISSIAPVLVYLPMNFGAMSAMVLFENMQKLEVWIESQTPTILIEKSKVLFDPENTLQQVETQPAKLEDLRFALEQCLGNFWFGVSHTLGIKSGEFIAAVRGLSNQVDYFVTVKILEQKKFRGAGGGRNNRYLTPAVQKELEGILAIITDLKVRLAIQETSQEMRINQEILEVQEDKTLMFNRKSTLKIIKCFFYELNSKVIKN